MTNDEKYMRDLADRNLRLSLPNNMDSQTKQRLENVFVSQQKKNGN